MTGSAAIIRTRRRPWRIEKIRRRGNAAMNRTQREQDTPLTGSASNEQDATKNTQQQTGRNEEQGAPLTSVQRRSRRGNDRQCGGPGRALPIYGERPWRPPATAQGTRLAAAVYGARPLRRSNRMMVRVAAADTACLAASRAPLQMQRQAACHATVEPQLDVRNRRDHGSTQAIVHRTIVCVVRSNARRRLQHDGKASLGSNRGSRIAWQQT